MLGKGTHARQLSNHRTHLAMFAFDGHHQAMTVPVDTVINLNGKKFNGDPLMDVAWDGRMVLMFTEHLRRMTVPA